MIIIIKYIVPTKMDICSFQVCIFQQFLQDFSVLTQSRDKSRESCKYWINYNWAKPQKSLVKEKDNFFFFFFAAICIWKKKIHSQIKKKTLLQGYLCFYLAIRVRFSRSEQWGDEIYVLFGYRSYQQFCLHCAISKFWINGEVCCVLHFPAVGLQPDAFPRSPHLLFLNTKLLFLCCKEMS